MMIRIGTGRVRRSFSRTRKPLRLGIIMSRITRSGSSRSAMRQALVAVAGDEDSIAGRLQGNPHRFDDLAVVIDQQDAFWAAVGCFSWGFSSTIPFLPS